MKVVVTGGAGFIGSSLAEQLVSQGMDVTILDNFTTGSRQNLAGIASKITVVEADIRDTAATTRACAGADWVFHLAALTSVTQSTRDPETTVAINTQGTRGVLEAASQQGVKRVIFSSTCAVYGDGYEGQVHEALTPLPKSPYAASKYQAELLAQSFQETHGLETVSLRYFNVYGARQRADSEYASVIPRFIERYRQRQAPLIYGTGEQQRDFIHVSDIVRANLLAAQAPLGEHRVFNIGTGESLSLLTLLDQLSQLMGYTLAPVFEPARSGDILNSCADTQRTQAALGFKTETSLAEGLRDLINAGATLPL